MEPRNIPFDRAKAYKNTILEGENSEPLLVQLKSGAIFAEPKKIQFFDFAFFLFFNARNNNATAFPDDHQSSSGKKQIFLKFSNFCKKNDFEAF